MSEIQGWKFRLAGPDDAMAFTEWTLSNPQIDQRDIEAGKKKNNPTVTYFAVENPAGQVVGFAPVYLQAVMAHLVFNPESSSADRKQCLQLGLDGIMAAVSQWGVNEIGMLSKEEYGVAKWAASRGFELDPRQFFKLDINRARGRARGRAKE